MNQLRATQQRIAREKIIKSQQKYTKKIEKSKRNTNVKSTIKKSRLKENQGYFPKIPNNQIVYYRPQEARPATKQEQQKTQKFKDELNERKKTRKYKFEDFLRAADQDRIQQQKKKILRENK